MVFAIPDWEDGNVKKNSIFSEKPTTNNKNGSPKKSPQKKNSKAEKKLHNVAVKSKLINKENKMQQKKFSNVNNEIANNKTNDSKATRKKIPKVINLIGKGSNKVLKKKVKEKPKNKNTKTDSEGLKVDNFDTDKLDEVLLNAKKKKFNEALQKDDVEAVLFQEDKNQEVKKNLIKQNGKGNNTVLNKQPYTEKKQKKLKNGKIIKVKDNNNIENILKVKTDKIIPSQQVKVDKKKEKLKGMLKETSNRNPINFNRNKLRERMLDRLKSAQFRFLNEKLYTSSGSEASELFQSDPTAFHNYHEGYQQQVKKWPVNPLDIIVKRIQKMPKSHLIADMGCGEAALAKRVPHTVRSFDLVATAPGVEVCDMAHTPLLAASVDAVVYCLALMGTELTKYLIEANRVLKTGGHLLIAEVESRFTDVNAFTKEVSRLGFKLQKLDNERQVFFFMEFVKNQDPPVKKSKLPVLTLKPCIYKRR